MRRTLVILALLFAPLVVAVPAEAASQFGPHYSVAGSAGKCFARMTLDTTRRVTSLTALNGGCTFFRIYAYGYVGEVAVATKSSPKAGTGTSTLINAGVCYAEFTFYSTDGHMRTYRLYAYSLMWQLLAAH